jgi:hypothetical protein
MPRNCSKKGASHASHTRNPSALSTSSTGSTVKPTTPPVDYSKDTPSSGDASKPPTTQPTPTSTHSVAPSSEPSPAPASTGGSGDVSQADITAYLTAQNNIRGNHGAANLTWNADLSAKALSWASKCKFQHSDGTLGPFGGTYLPLEIVWCFLKTGAQKTSLPVPEMRIRLHRPSNPGLMKFVRRIYSRSDTTQGLMYFVM